MKASVDIFNFRNQILVDGIKVFLCTFYQKDSAGLTKSAIRWP